MCMLALCHCSSYAQLCIEGRETFYDEVSHLWLATIPQESFHGSQRLRIALKEPWQHATINGQTADSTCLFRQLEPNRMYATILTDSQGHTLAGFLTFTTLPVVRLQGHFGYEYAPATITIADPQDASNLISPARCKWRGGSTNAPDKHKRNYKIDFADDVSLFGMRKDNKWLLDAGQADVFRLRNRIATELWNHLASPPYYIQQQPKARLGVEGRVVELFLNNRYYGIYSLTENMDRKLTRVKKCSQSEVHGCMWKAVSYENTQMKTIGPPYDNRSERWCGFEMKYPKLDDNDTTDWSTLYNAIQFCIESNKTVFQEHVAEYFDLPVLVDYYIFTNALLAIDNSGKNMIWTLYDKQADKRITPMPWDLDCTVGQPWAKKYSPSYTSPYYPLKSPVYVIERLLATNASNFNGMVVDRYRYLRLGCLATDSLIARYERYYRLLTSSGAARRETQRWSGDSDLDGRTIDFDSQIAYITDWIAKRMSYMDGRINYIYRLSLAHASATRQRPAASYSLSGTKMPGTGQQLRPGIYIVGGRKTVVGR